MESANHEDDRHRNVEVDHYEHSQSEHTPPKTAVNGGVADERDEANKADQETETRSHSASKRDTHENEHGHQRENEQGHNDGGEFLPPPKDQPKEVEGHGSGHHSPASTMSKSEHEEQADGSNEAEGKEEQREHEDRVADTHGDRASNHEGHHSEEDHDQHETCEKGEEHQYDEKAYDSDHSQEGQHEVEGTGEVTTPPGHTEERAHDEEGEEREDVAEQEHGQEAQLMHFDEEEAKGGEDHETMENDRGKTPEEPELEAKMHHVQEAAHEDQEEQGDKQDAVEEHRIASPPEHHLHAEEEPLPASGDHLTEQENQDAEREDEGPEEEEEEGKHEQEEDREGEPKFEPQAEEERTESQLKQADHQDASADESPADSANVGHEPEVAAALVPQTEAGPETPRSAGSRASSGVGQVAKPKAKSPSKSKQRASPRHQVGAPLRGRPAPAARSAVPPSSTVTRLPHTGGRRAQSHSPQSGMRTKQGQPAEEPGSPQKPKVDIHAIFGDRGGSKGLRRAASKREEGEKGADREHRRKEAEAAYNAWLQRKTQDIKRARSSGRTSASDGTEELTPEEKQKRKAEADAAFRAWLDRKKEAHKDNRAQMAGSKSLQRLVDRETVDEAFRSWKEQKEAQKREERRLARAQIRELETVVPLANLDSSLSSSGGGANSNNIGAYRRRVLSQGNTVLAKRSKQPPGTDSGKKLPRLYDHRRVIIASKSYPNYNKNIRTVSPWRPQENHENHIEKNNGNLDVPPSERLTTFPSITPPLPGGHNGIGT